MTPETGSGHRMWFDSHCHLDLPGFDTGPTTLWQEARQAGVTQAFVPGVDPEQWETQKRIATLPGIRTGVGLHPFALERWSELPEPQFRAQLKTALQTLREHAQNRKHVAIGECGFDKLLAKRCPRLDLALQTELVTAQLHIAIDAQLPVVLHVVQAHGLALRTLETHRVPQGGVIHAYSGSPELVIRYQRLGFRLGFGPALLRQTKVQAALRATAKDHVVLETDAPLSPRTRTWCENSPRAVATVGQAASEILSIPLSDLAALTSYNSETVFRGGQ